MEKINEEGSQVDLYRLTEDLRLELDDVLPIVEAAEVLGFATVDQGDIKLTALGQAFADASIVARKEILAGRVLRLPTIRWIYETLQKDDNNASPKTTSSNNCRTTSATTPKISWTLRWIGAAMRNCSPTTNGAASCSWKKMSAAKT